MDEKDIKLLSDWDWEVVCYSPFEIEHRYDSESKASGIAAELILDFIRRQK